MLQIKNIAKQYKTGDLVQQALNDVSFSLRDNEFVSILGPSGSGKTTLLNIIGGLDRYDSGDLIINGVSTENYKNSDWDTYRNHTIGFVFQSYNLIQHQSILSNVELALTIGGVSRGERKKRAIKALEEVGLGEQIHKKPNQLSGGQMQRVAIARALVNNPDILLADEPTGALDSDTSVQIMELLKKVAQDRLVVMVTHNAELAEEYSTRIIRLKDGKITADSNPVTEMELTEAAAFGNAWESGSKKISVSKNSDGKKKARMSFLTSLALSANNLKSKKGRTVLISLASSIGIIGIALILSISTGVNDYILNIQKETMSSYPISISAQTMDLTSLLQEGTSLRDELTESFLNAASDDGTVHADYSEMKTSEVITTNLTENDLTAFKKYLDDPESKIHEYLGENGIVYTYDINFDVYTRDTDGNLQSTDADVADIVDTDSGFASMSESMNLWKSNMQAFTSGGAVSGASNFSEMTAGAHGDTVSQVVKDNYDLLYGSWPEEYNEVVLVLNTNNSLSAETLYQLGIMSGHDYLTVASQIENGEATDSFHWDYEDICGHTFLMVTASDRYVMTEDGLFTYLDDTAANLEKLMENAVELKITGIIRPNEDASAATIQTAVAYTSKFTDYCIQHSEESEVIKAQQANPQVNVLTGMKFVPENEEEKAADAIQNIKNMSLEEKAQLYSAILYYESGENASENMLSADSSLEDLMDMFGVSDNGSLTAILSLLGTDYTEKIYSSISSMLTDESQQAALLDKWLDEEPDQEILAALYDQYSMGGSYDDNMTAFGLVSYDAPTSISIYTDTFEDKDGVTACIEEYNETAGSEEQIVYTDYIALITSSITSIVNAISYVLIAFVAISLIVSCIMIGIITHISVLERTKEIGILRAMGASRRNISQVFNAETVIIGLISGLFGIIISMLFTLPINLILKLLLGSTMINVNLPVLYALMLIAISVIVTLIGGLIPAAKAAKKDPVIALRTE